jgi:hypothetical protein
MNHREGERTRLDLPVIVHRRNCTPVQGRLRDVSLSGAGIEYYDTVEINPMDTLELLITPPGSMGLEPVRVAGFVVRRRDGWLGVMFMREAPWLVRTLRGAVSQPEHLPGRATELPVSSRWSVSNY